MLTLLVGLAFAVLLLEVQSQSISAKSIALLGVLVAINRAALCRRGHSRSRRLYAHLLPHRADRLRLRRSLRLSHGRADAGRLGSGDRHRRPLAALPDVHGRVDGSVRAALPSAGASGQRTRTLGGGDCAGPLRRRLGAALRRGHEHLVLALRHRSAATNTGSRASPLSTRCVAMPSSTWPPR